MEFVSENAVPKCMTLDDICQSTNHNSLLQNVIECLESGKRYKFKDDKTMDIFSRLREEITVRRLSNVTTCLLFQRNYKKGNKISTPRTSWNRTH